MQMVTYSDLIQIGILVVGIINLFKIKQKEVTAPVPHSPAVTYATTGGTNSN